MLFRSNITLEIIEKNPDKDWVWNSISGNPNLTIKYIEENLNKDWDWNFMSCNPNLTIDFIEKNLDKDWDWIEIIKHTFKIDYDKELKKLRFENYHEELIQKAWHPKRFQDWCLDNDDDYNN